MPPRIHRRLFSPRLAWQYAILAALLGMFALFLIYPIALTLKGGFTRVDDAGKEILTLEHIRLVLADAVLRESFLNSFLVAIGTTTLAIFISLPLAVLSANFRFPGKAIFNAAILVPLILPPFVGALGMKALLGREGALNALLGTQWDILGEAKYWGVIATQALALYPIIYLNATASLANLDPALDEAAKNLGAGWWRRFLRITLPLIRPGLFAGATIVFIWSFTELGAPLVFDYYRVAPVQIYQGLKEIDASPKPYAMTVLMLGGAIALYALGRFVFGRKGHAMYSKASRASSETPMGALGGSLAASAFLLVSSVALLPHVGVILTSLSAPGQWYASILPKSFTLSHYEQAMTASDSFIAIRNSLFLAAAAMFFDVLIGILVAYLIVRTTIRGRHVLDALCMLPLAVPGLVLAFGYAAMSLEWPFAPTTQGLRPWPLNFLAGLGIIGLMGVVIFLVRKHATLSKFDTGLLGAAAIITGCVFAMLGWPITGRIPLSDWFAAGPLRPFAIFSANPNPFLFLVIAYSVRRLPYIVRSSIAGLEQTSGELEEAAMNLGATRLTAVRRVVLPLIMANIIAGGLLVFSFSMLEVSDSIILAQQPDDYPITKAILAFSERLGDGPYIASALGAWGMALLAITLVTASTLLGKKLGSIFRV